MGGFAADRRHGNHVELIHDVRQNPLTIGTGHEVVGGNRFVGKVDAGAFDVEMSAAIGTVVAQRNQSAGRVNVNAILFVGKVRAAGAARRKNQIRFAAVGGNPDQIGVAGLTAIERAVFAVVGVAAQKNDFGAVRRKHRVAVDRQRFGELHRRSAGGGNFPELAAFAGPGNVGDPFSIRRPGRLKFGGFAGGEPLRFSAWQIERVKMGHRGKRELSCRPAIPRDRESGEP